MLMQEVSSTPTYVATTKIPKGLLKMCFMAFVNAFPPMEGMQNDNPPLHQTQFVFSDSRSETAHCSLHITFQPPRNKLKIESLLDKTW